ncbi:hypothetical protein BKA65DRAFT_65489 [Rhexocercosporidium sp. MPI-PUGE-AT-0058]|nr:hypothetical protein BKA65DRAFT_65489 [Rhexocercosporidium sp. MPI-PUGE-AT-0058]
MASSDYLLPTVAQCESLTNDQCRQIQDILDPQGIRANKDWEISHQYDLIRLYMTMKSFNQIEHAMKKKMDCSYKTYNNRFRGWLFPTNQAEREQMIVGLYAAVSNQPNPAPVVIPPPQNRILLPIRSSPPQQASQVPVNLFPHPQQHLVSESSQQRNSISTVSTFSSGFSVATTNSSASSVSQYAAPPRPQLQPPPQPQVRPPQPPKHDPNLGLWNDILRVIPCRQNHSLLMWYETFPRCSVCGFSQWHALMLHAGSDSSRTFLNAMRQLKDLIKHDFAGNYPVHFLMSAGVGMDYFIHLDQQCNIGGQNVFGQNPLHVLNPRNLGDQLIGFLEYFNTRDPLPGVLLSQRDIYCVTPLQTLLQQPLEGHMYHRVLKTFPCALISLRSLDTSGRCVMVMMNNASLKIKRESTKDWEKIQNGITVTESFLAEAKSQSGSVQDYGFHDIARGARGTPWYNISYQCRICNQTCDPINTHTISYLDQIACAWDYGRDCNAADRFGMTPAHLLVTNPRCNSDGSSEKASDTAALFRKLLPHNYPNLREALHVLDPEGNSLIFNIATRGFDEILEYALALEDPSRRPSMVNACSKKPKGKSSSKEWSVLEAVIEKIAELDERLRYAHLTMSDSTVRRLCEESNRLKRCKHILIAAGAQMNPSITTRYKICD